MAEAVLFDLATAILKCAGCSTFSKIQLLQGATEELGCLKNSVETIQAVLLDAEKQQWDNNQLKLWLGRLKDVLYDVHDLLDDVATEDLRRKVMPGSKRSKAVRIFFSKSNQLVHDLEVAGEIQKVRKRLDLIVNEKKFDLKLHLNEETMAMAIARGKKPEISSPDKQIIGREKDKKEIKKLLFDSSSSDSVSFVSIVGKGGLGKTALARLAYNDRKVGKRFDLKKWVCVSDVFDVNLIIKEILKLNEKDYKNKSSDELKILLQKTLDNKKYLLVLDDMWNEVRHKWLALGDWLKGGKRGSKILITTRSYTVAKVTNKNSAIYALKGLTIEKSWDLFRKVAFEERQVDKRWEEMGRDIVRKCAGVPLAIITLGSFLYDKNEDQWNYYKVKELPEIPEIDMDDNGIMQVLKFSYNHLESNLKHCFAYCSLFPKDHIYMKETMMPLWVAQGFVNSHNGEDNLKVADNYLLKLTCRSFLDVVRKGDNGEVLLFKMHDLMHDLAQKVAGGECKIVKFKGGDNDGRIRHVSFISNDSSEEKMPSLLETSKLRTILYLKGGSSILNSSEVSSECRHCRALVLCESNIPLPPSFFGKLGQLRSLYIFTNQSIENLPDSITDLVNLQFLKLFGCMKLKTFPTDLRKLVNLRYLSIHMCPSLSHLPLLSELPLLRTLSLMGLHALKFIQQASDPKRSNTMHPLFPSLENLVLFDCKGLIRWWERRQDKEAYQKHESDNPESSFPKLRSVEINKCPDLKFVPPFPQVECLKIDSTKMLKKQLPNSNRPLEPPVESRVIHFSKLKHLVLSVRDLVPPELEPLFRLASNLMSMRLHGINGWGPYRGMEHLSLLQEPLIQRSEGLRARNQAHKKDLQWQLPMKLRVLEISSISWRELSEGIQDVMTLQSLEKLALFDCPRLEHLPSEIHNLTCLKELRIINCPNLKESCLTDVHRPVIIRKSV